MDEMYFPLIVIGIIAFSVVLLVLCGWGMYLSHDTKVNREKNASIERREELKNEREFKKAEVQGLELRRGIISDQIDAGLLNGDNQRDDDSGLGGLINMVLQNPQLLQGLLGKTAGNMQGGDNGANAPSFPASPNQPPVM